jgi:molybdopterin biosynthesis enzyme
MVAARPIAQRIARLVPLPEAIHRIDQCVTAVAPRQAAPAGAVGRTLASDRIVAAEALPARALALRDGWAVRSDAILDAGSYAPAVLTEPPVVVEVGNSLPANTDAVIPLDAVEFADATASALHPASPGEGVLLRGADIVGGEALFHGGRRISRLDLAVLMASGHGDISIREPRVHVVPAREGADTIIDAIGALLCGAIEAAGGVAIKEASSSGSVVEMALRDGDADAVVIVGGSGAGDRDHSVETLARLGRVEFHGVGLTPGETAAFGMVDKRPVLVLPGRLDAALAVWLVLGRHMLARLAARDGDDPDPAWPVTLARKITSTVGLAEVIVGRRDGGRAVPLASGYLSLQALAQADGWILVPPDLEGVPADAMVLMKPLP